MLGSEVRKYLFSIADEGYRDFTSSLVNNVDKKYFIGVRVPILRQLAKKLSNDVEYFQTKLLEYREEILLYGFAIGYSKNTITNKLDLYFDYLQYANSWETVDTVFQGVKDFNNINNKSVVFDAFTGKIDYNNEYLTRAVLVVLMRYFLTDEYIDKVVLIAQNIHSDKYYINMALSWLIAEILAKYYTKGVELLTSGKLSNFVVNKAIQKAQESYKIPKETKKYLLTLKV